MRIVHLGKQHYGKVLRLQEALFAERKRGEGIDTILTVEHSPSVITVGNRRKEGMSDVLLDEEQLKHQQIEIFELDRGGRATWHGRGQVTVYPICNIQSLHKRSGSKKGLVGWWVNTLEKTIIHMLWDEGLRGWTCSDVGVWVGGPLDSHCDENIPSVEEWMQYLQQHPVSKDSRLLKTHGNQRKIAAIGVRLSRYCSMHGLSLNVHPNLDEYKTIVPCGLSDSGVTSIHNEQPYSPTLAESVGGDLVDKFLKIVSFEGEVTSVAADDIFNLYDIV
eukprot:TRINITY_DN10443_c0_g1_i1.p1 TRINITY_DN10443_c0_g1~~TRINITY_DN10443_c0_g1_i1.p1  ORF type:complete len:293 (+),score=55.45 TRINITY_DN10443_c0_g1_i1:53-880(+)